MRTAAFGGFPCWGAAWWCHEIPLRRKDYPEYYSFLERLFATVHAKPRIAVECDSASSLITEVEAGRGIALASPNFKLVAGKRLLYRPLTGTTEVGSVGIARAAKGDVTPAGERFCEILRKNSDGATAPKPKPASSWTKFDPKKGTPRWPVRAVDCAHFAPPTQRTRRDGLVHGRSVLLSVARGGDDYAFVPPVVPSSNTDRLSIFLLNQLDHPPYGWNGADSEIRPFCR
jgi:LysR substrate binding domain